jgi:ADP-heptose:LPS heptosyltransferase
MRLEGGIGDHLCSIRFLPAIRELYPECKFYGFSDTGNNYAQKKIITTFWPSLFENIEVIPNKIDKEYTISHQFGKEKYISAFENIPIEYRNRMLNSFDKFYDLHIDGLKWLTYDFNWSKYFFQFLTPEINLGEKKLTTNQVAISLYSDSNSSNLLNKEYATNLIREISKQYKTVIFATPQNIDYYSDCSDFSEILILDIIDVVKTIQNSSAFLCIDSGLKFLGYCVNTPTINFLSQIQQYGQLPPHQYIRWNPFIWSAMPLHYNIPNVIDIINNSIKYNTNLLPSIPDMPLENLIVKRIYD